jgi:hypothetical protein
LKIPAAGQIDRILVPQLKIFFFEIARVLEVELVLEEVLFEPHVLPGLQHKPPFHQTTATVTNSS